MATVNGTNGADSLSGTSSADTINGLNGNDTLKGFGGADRLDGGAGIDTASYFNSTVGVSVNLSTGRGFGGDAEGDTLISIDNLVGSSFNDTLTGDAGRNELIGLEGNDVLKGGGGADRLGGGTGDDILKGGGGADELSGGAGNDTADYSDSAEGVFVDLLHNGASGGDAQGDTFISIESITGSANTDGLDGDDNANGLRGGGGDDRLSGHGGVDFLDAGSGNDFLNGGSGADTMIGGLGNDSYLVQDAGDVVIEHGGEGMDTVVVGISYTLAADAEIEVMGIEPSDSTTAINLTGSSTGNQIFGNNGDNIIDGGGGIDQLIGRGGNDTYIVDVAGDVVTELVGQGTFDRVRTSTTYSLAAGSEVEVLETTNQAGTTALDLVGNEFGNTVVGNNGSNTIVGGLGQDTMTGNGGADVFVWSSIAETGATAGTADIVGADFNPLAGDLIALNPIDADETIGGNQAFTFVGTAAFTAPGQVSFFTDGFDTYLQLNTDGDASPEAMIRVLGVHNVDASWFVL